MLIRHWLGTAAPPRAPLLIGVGGLALTIVGYVIYGLHDANMFGVSSTEAFQEQTRLAGNAARSESYWNLLLVVPAEVITVLGFMIHLRRKPDAPRFFRKATTIGLSALPIYVVSQAFVRITILVGMGRIDLDDPNHLVDVSETTISIILYVGTLATWAFNVTTFPLLIMAVALIVRRVRR